MPAAMNKQNKHLKPNHGLSNLDRASITINYPPDDGNEMVEQALDVIGVGITKNQFIKSYQTGQWARLREEFAEWSRSAIEHGGLIIDPLWVRLGQDRAIPITKNNPELSLELSAGVQAIEDGFQEMGVDSRVWAGLCVCPPNP